MVPSDLLALAHERGCRFRAEAAAARLRSRPPARRTLAATLRRLANQLDPAPLAPGPA
jgi:hypothetical protein